MANKIKLPPREDRVIRYLRNKSQFIFSDILMRKYGNKKGITVKECDEVLGTTELRKIISELRDHGVVVTDVWEEGENRFGEKTRYKRYFILSNKKKGKKK